MRTKAELEVALEATRGVPEASCEEYVEGEEFTFDTVCIDGKPAFENVAAYLPKPLEARSQEWVSPVIITVRDMYQERLAPGVELGRKVLTAWPSTNRLTLTSSWLFAKTVVKFGPGRYTWFVWPGLGLVKDRHYGELLGQSWFVVK